MAEARVALLSQRQELAESVRVALSFAGLELSTLAEPEALDEELEGDDPIRAVLVDLASCADPEAVAERVRSVPVGADVAVFFLGSGVEGEPVSSTEGALAIGGDAYFSLPAEAARVLARLSTYLDLELPRVPASLELGPAASDAPPHEDDDESAAEPSSLVGLEPPLEEEPAHELYAFDEDEDAPEVTAEMDARTLSRLHKEAADEDEDEAAGEEPEDDEDTDPPDDLAGDIARRVQRLRSRLAEGRRALIPEDPLGERVKPLGLLAPEGADQGADEDARPTDPDLDALLGRTDDELSQGLPSAEEVPAPEPYPPLEALPALGGDEDDDDKTVTGFLAPPPSLTDEEALPSDAEAFVDPLAGSGGLRAVLGDSDEDFGELDAAFAPPAVEFADAEVGPLLDELGLVAPPEDAPPSGLMPDMDEEATAVTLTPFATAPDGPVEELSDPSDPSEPFAAEAEDAEDDDGAAALAAFEEASRELEERLRLEAEARFARELEERLALAMDEAACAAEEERGRLEEQLREEADARLRAEREELEEAHREELARLEEQLRAEADARLRAEREELEEAHREELRRVREELEEAHREELRRVREELEGRLQRDADERVASLARDLAEAEARVRVEEERRRALEEERVRQAEEEERLREELEARLQEEAERAAEAERYAAEAELRAQDALSRAEESERQVAEAENRVTEAEDRVTEAEDRVTEAEDRVTEAENRVTEAEDRVTEAERQAAEAEARAVQAAEQRLVAEQQASEALQQRQEAAQQAVEALQRAEAAEQQASEAIQQRLTAEQQAAEALQRAKAAEQRRLAAEQQAAEVEARAVQAEQRAEAAERQASEALQHAEAVERQRLAAEQQASEALQQRSVAEREAYEALEGAEAAEQRAAAAEQRAEAAEQRVHEAEARAAEADRLREEALQRATEAAEAARQQAEAAETARKESEERLTTALDAAREAEEQAARALAEERSAREEAEAARAALAAELEQHQRRWAFRAGAALGAEEDGGAPEAPREPGPNALGVGRIYWWGADEAGAPLDAVSFAPGGELEVEPPPPPESWIAVEPLEGAFGEGDLPRLLWGAHVLEVTGALVLVDKSGLSRTLYLERGEPVGFASELTRDRPEEALLRAGLITAAKHAELRAGPLSSARRTCARLVDEGALKPQELFTAIRGVLIEQVLSLLELTGGSFRYEREAAHAKDRVRLQHRFDALLAEGVRRKYDLSRLWRVLGGPQTLVGPDDRALRLPPLTPEERVALSLLDGQRSLEDAVLDGALPPEDVLRAAFLGVSSGAARVVARGVPGAPKEQRQDHERALAIDKARIEERLHVARHGDYFAFLGIATDATSVEVRRAAEHLRKQFDSRRYSDPAFKALQEALDEIRQVADEAEAVLADDSLRAGYVRNRRAAVS